jgi:hypothetical protein
MAWCPQCGAEYREGIAQCAKCRVALSDQAPAPVITPWRDQIPPPLRRIAKAFARPFGYASEAWRLLRRHPALLVLPLAVAVFNAVERQVPWYVASRHGVAVEAFLGEHSNSASETDAFVPPLTVRDLVPLEKAVRAFAHPVPALSLQTGLLVMALDQAAGQAGQISPYFVVLLQLLIVLPLSALLMSGYYGVIGGGVAGDATLWRRFWTYLRRCFLRFWLFAALLALFANALLPTTPRMFDWVWVLWTWACLTLIVEFVTALTLVAIVVDDAALLPALRSGVRVVVRDLPVALLLLAGWVVVLALFAVLRHWAGVTVAGSLHLYSTLQVAIMNALLAAVGAWFLIISFVWYRDRRPAALPATPRTSEDRQRGTSTPV